MITLEPGKQGLPRLVLRTPDGASADIYLHGAHLTSWRPAGGDEALFLSDASMFTAGEPIRGGVPVIFPQFSGDGPLPKHGFARTTSWEWANQDDAETAERAVLRLTDTPATRALWPHAFLIELTVTLRGDAITIGLTVENGGRAELEFAAALHTYLRVADISKTTVTGLQGTHYRSKPEAVTNVPDRAAVLEITGEIDRRYRNAPRSLRVDDAGGERAFLLESVGFQDAVVWNPWSELSASIPDMNAKDYREMLCVEAAQIEAPVRLAPGAVWAGEQRIHCVGADS